MIELLRLILHIMASFFKPRTKLVAEILILRQQLNVLRRQVSKRPQLSNTDRFLFVWLYRWFPSVLSAIAILRPETIIRWHRAGFQSYWRERSRKPVGRPRISAELRNLIGAMSRANYLWDAISRGGPAAVAVKSRVEVTGDFVCCYVTKSCHAHDGIDLVIAPVLVQVVAETTLRDDESPVGSDQSVVGEGRVWKGKELVVPHRVTAARPVGRDATIAIWRRWTALAKADSLSATYLVRATAYLCLKAEDGTRRKSVLQLSAPKKRLDNFNTPPQELPLSRQPPQEAPLATPPRQEQPTPKIKQIAKLTTAVVLAAIAIVLGAYAFILTKQ
jgi:hypothetical protein